MAWAESDRVQIRLYLGASSMWLQADSRLESAITNSQAVADGGTRPDNSTELAIRSVISTLQCIDARILELASSAGATAVPSGRAAIQLDAARETARQRSVGRQYVHRLARFLDTSPYADVFSSSPTRWSGYPNSPMGGHDPYAG